MPTPHPLFLIGAPRSGTTLLYKALCLHPQVAWISNWNRRLPRLPAAAWVNGIAARYPQLRDRVWFGDGDNAYVYGRRRTLRHRAFPQPVEGEPLYHRCGIPQYPAAPPAPDAAGRLRYTFGRLARHQPGDVLVSKRIANNWRVPLLEAAFPAARYIDLLRDGRAVAASLATVDWWADSHVWWYGDTPRAWSAEGRDPWELCARHWIVERDVIEQGLETISPERVLQIRYEDLVADPVAVIGQVAEHAGLSTDGGWTERLAALRLPDRNRAWAGRLGDAAERVSQVQHETLVRYGYATAGVG